MRMQISLLAKGLLLLGVGTLLIAVLVFSDSDTKPIDAPESLQEAHSMKPAAQVILPFAVSGIVDATESMTLRTQTAGTIDSIRVREGDIVNAQTLLLTQDTSVLDRRLELQEAQNTLGQQKQHADMLAKNDAAARTTAQFTGSQEKELLLNTDTLEQAEVTQSLLLVAAHAAALQVSTVLDFYDVQRSYFPAQTLDLYLSVLTNIYGDQPNYLSNGIIYNVPSGDDILRELQLYKDQSIVDGTQLYEATTRLATQLAILQQLLTQSESIFFDESIVDPESDLYATFMEYRSAVLSSQVALRTAQQNFTSADNAVKQTKLAGETERTISQINALAAAKQSALSDTMTLQTGVVQKAQLGVLYAQKNLAQSYAPFSGIVSHLFVDTGEYVQPGSPLLTLEGVSGYETVVHIPIQMVDMLQEGQEFLVDGAVVGRVSHFAPTAITGSVNVFIELTGTHVPGEYVSGQLQLHTDHTNIIEVPRSYIYFTNEGPAVRSVEHILYPVEILYDASDVLYVRTDSSYPLELIPAVQTTL